MSTTKKHNATNIVAQQTLLWNLHETEEANIDTVPMNADSLDTVDENNNDALSTIFADITEGSADSTIVQNANAPTQILSGSAHTALQDIQFDEVSKSIQIQTTILDNRYEVMGYLGSGGMGEVLEVFDHKFRRKAAMKIMHPNLTRYPLIIELFKKEAQSTGLLQHPGTVPVYDFGTLSDNRFFFTMPVIQGITLYEAIQLAHSPSTPAQWSDVQNDWSINRLLQAFLDICHTLAYAHELHIVHRDIKPSNFMLGKHGEVLVMDWGIAKILPAGEKYFNLTTNIRPSEGSVVGTPHYISPEQAQGESPNVDETSDIFSLGCVLYEIITGNMVRNGSAKEALEQINTHCPTLETNRPIDEALQEIYQRCIAPEKNKRFQHAGELLSHFQRWLEGENKRQKAVFQLKKAKKDFQSWLALQNNLLHLSETIQHKKSTIKTWGSIQEKEELWLLEDQYNALVLQRDLLQINSIEALHSALHHDPELDDAHIELARIYHHKHLLAVQEKNNAESTITQELLKIHDRGEFAEYLKGMGTIEIIAANKTWRVHKYVEEKRRLVPQYVLDGKNSQTLHLPLASYVLECNISGSVIHIPFNLSYMQSQQKIHLPDTLKISKKEAYIHEGNCIIGHKNEPHHPERSVWIDSFSIQKYPVSMKEYIEFLEDVRKKEGVDVALAMAPHYQNNAQKPIVILDQKKDCFVLVTDPTGDDWHEEWPVLLVSKDDMLQYAQWYSKQTGMEWTLPTFLEWEKAARGVDARSLPWGEYFEPTWACVRGSKEGKPLPASIYDHPLDCSPYGVFGFAGNAQDLCYSPETPDKVYIKGGAWAHHSEFINMAIHRPFTSNMRLEVCGFRLIHRHKK